ncbi:MAG: ATP-binding cassette domain-containing protein [Planctomycetota bacterium]|nr:ATP-binding cassette domain-containing protein [Planctomycetota bacterium]
MVASKPNARVPIELCAEGLAKRFGSEVVLENLDLEVASGELIAIVGASGCGKTVLLHLLIGLHQPSAGRVLARHHGWPEAPLVDLSTLDETGLEDIRLSWSVVFQHNALFAGSVYDNCAIWLREHPHLDEAIIRTRVREALADVGLDVDEVIEKERGQLSGGMAKRVAVARALVPDPMVIFYDEPTTGLDPMFGAQIQELIWSTHHRPRQDGQLRTSVIVSHDRELLRRLHPRVVMLHEAGICFDGPYDAFCALEEGPPHDYMLQMPGLHARPPREALRAAPHGA